MPWTIDYYSEHVRQEIDSLPVGIRASYARLTELLEEFGLELRMPIRGLWGMVSLTSDPKGERGLPGYSIA